MLEGSFFNQSFFLKSMSLYEIQTQGYWFFSQLLILYNYFIQNYYYFARFLENSKCDKSKVNLTRKCHYFKCFSFNFILMWKKGMQLFRLLFEKFNFLSKVTFYLQLFFEKLRPTIIFHQQNIWNQMKANKIFFSGRSAAFAKIEWSEIV